MNQNPDRLFGEVLCVDRVSASERDQMFRLMQKHYQNVSRDGFDRDFDAKTWVIVARCPRSQEVLGFSTQSFDWHQINSKSVGVLFSGDTIIDQSYWARNPLAGLWGNLVLGLIDHYPNQKLVWFLICKGYKTYRYLPIFFHQFYPSRGQPFCPEYRQIMDAVAADFFPDQYSDQRGIVVATDQGCCLRAGVASVTQERLNDPEVSYFVTMNPGHSFGDELCCIAPLSRENFKRVAHRLIDSVNVTVTTQDCERS